MATNVEAAWVKYATVAASQTAQVLKTGTRLGSTGDKLRSLVIVPSTTSPGAVTVADGAGAAITVYPGGASAISSLTPTTVTWEAASVNGAWSVTTGAAM
jgi:hypothetical protein